MSENEDTNVITTGKLRKLLQKFNEDLGVYVNDEERNKLGKVLTIIDASFADTEQRKAVKDLVNNVWWGNVGIGAYAREVRSDGMSNPHQDLRAICELLGFELYPASTGALTEPVGENLDWNKKRYENHLKTR